MEFLSKTDLAQMYGASNPKQFLALIGKKGEKILEWKEGKQRFSPKQVRQLYKFIGKPLSKEEKYH